MTQGWDLDKQRRTLQVSISKRERLAGTLVFQASERNKNRRGRGNIPPPSLCHSRGQAATAANLSCPLRAPVGGWLLRACPRPCAESGRLWGWALGEGGPRGRGGVLLQGWRERAAMTFKDFGSNFPPACQRPPRGKRTCVFSCVRSLITHSLLHSFIHSLIARNSAHTPGGHRAGLRSARFT